MQMGHGGSPTMLYNHYYRPGITRKEALEWWGESTEEVDLSKDRTGKAG